MTSTDARNAIAGALREIAPEVDLDACDPTQPLNRELDLDSMDILSLLGGLSERTGVDVPESAVDPEWSLDDLTGYLVEHSG